jgi:hypothetical protein
MPVGVAVTLRGERSYEFLDRLVSIAIPRIRDFRGLNPRSFDGRGNYSMGVKEQIIFPEVDYDAIDQVRGLDITITTTAATDAEAFALLYAFGMPFAAQGRPKGFNEAAGVVDSDGASGGQDEEPESAVQEQAAEPEAAEPEAAEAEVAEAEVAEAEAAEAEAAEAEPEAASGEPQAAAEHEAVDEEPQAAAEPEPEPEAVGEAPEPEAASEEPEASTEPVGADAEEAQQPEQQANAEKESSD